MVVGDTQLIELALESLHASLSETELVNLNGEFIDVLIFLLESALELVDSSDKFFDSWFETVDLGLVLTAASLEGFEVRELLLSLGELPSEFFDSPFFHY